MLKLYRKLAQQLNPFRRLLALLAFGVTVSFVIVLLWASQVTSEQWLLPLLVTLIFLLCLLLMVSLFSAEVKQQGGRIKRFFYWLWQWILCLLLTSLLLLWFFLFLRAFSAIIRQLW